MKDVLGVVQIFQNVKQSLHFGGIVTRQIKSTRPDLARLAAGQGLKSDTGPKD